MQSFRTVLFAADFSQNSHDAFRLACSLAVETKTRIIVLHVDGPTLVGEEPMHFAQASAPLPDSGHPDRAEAIKQRLRELYAPNRPIDVEYRVQEGDAAAEILRLAVEVGANLIVMGTHGRRGLSRLMAGSVATEVLHKSHCPVLALRAVPGALQPG